MTPFAVSLVLASALAHASWNVLAKHASGSRVFPWLCTVTAALITVPIAAMELAVAGTWPEPRALVFPIVSGLIHVGYFGALDRAYRAGDLSLVYPLARGTGPLLTVLLSILALGERPSTLAAIGIAAILLGILCLTGNPRALLRSGNGAAVGWALLTGAIIASYTLWDKHGVSAMGVPPGLYFALLMGTTSLFRAPLALRNPGAARREISAYWKSACAAGALIALAYVLVLTALVTSPVSYVAPMREIGILFGVVLGNQLLAEGQTRQRLLGAALMVAGAIALAAG